MTWLILILSFCLLLNDVLEFITEINIKAKKAKCLLKSRDIDVLWKEKCVLKKIYIKRTRGSNNLEQNLNTIRSFISKRRDYVKREDISFWRRERSTPHPQLHQFQIYVVFPLKSSTSCSRSSQVLKPLLPQTRNRRWCVRRAIVPPRSCARGRRALLLLLQVASHGPEQLGAAPHCWPRGSIRSRALGRQRHHLLHRRHDSAGPPHPGVHHHHCEALPALAQRLRQHGNFVKHPACGTFQYQMRWFCLGVCACFTHSVVRRWWRPRPRPRSIGRRPVMSSTRRTPKE